MSMYRVQTTEITGLSSSGATDDTGTWNTVDLDSFVTVPGDATAALIQYVNTATALRWIGMRTGGKDTPVIHVDMSGGRVSGTILVPLGTGNQIQLYCEEASSAKFYVLGFTSSEWTFFDIDAVGNPEFSITNPEATVSPTGSVIPANATVVTRWLRNQWRPSAESGMHSVAAAVQVQSNTALVKLDASTQIRMYNTVAIPILGYTTTGVTWTTWQGTAEAMTHDGTWRTGPSSNAGKAFGYLIPDTGNSGYGITFRDGSETIDWGAAALAYGSEGKFIPLDSSGEYQYISEVGTHPNYYIAAWIDPADDGISSSMNPNTRRSLIAMSGGMQSLG